MVTVEDIVAERSKAPDLGSGLSWRRFKSCRCHFFFYTSTASHGLCRFMACVVWSISERVFACDDDDERGASRERERVAKAESLYLGIPTCMLIYLLAARLAVAGQSSNDTK